MRIELIPLLAAAPNQARRLCQYGYPWIPPGTAAIEFQFSPHSKPGTASQFQSPQTAAVFCRSASPRIHGRAWRQSRSATRWGTGHFSIAATREHVANKGDDRQQQSTLPLLMPDFGQILATAAWRSGQRQDWSWKAAPSCRPIPLWLSRMKLVVVADVGRIGYRHSSFSAARTHGRTPEAASLVPFLPNAAVE